MVKMIEISISRDAYQKMNALVVCERGICYCNNKKYQVDDSFYEEIIRIIRFWKKEYGSTKDIHDEEFLVTVTTDSEVSMFHGKGIFPKNYHSLIALMEGLDVKCR